MLKAGVIGLGMMGRLHARVLQSLEGVELVGFSDPAPQYDGEYAGKPVYATVEELLGSGLDYCVVAAPTAFHLDVAMQLASAKVHALIEKPVAFDVESAERIVEAFAAANLVGGVGHIERFNPALQSMRKRLADGQLGEIYQVTTRRQGPFPGRIADVGVVKDLASHDIDLTAWITGQQYVSVSARTTHRSGRAHEDMVVAVGTLSDGTIVNHVVNWLSPFKERSTVVTGEFGSLVADTLTADLTFYENGKTSVVWDGVSSFRGVTEGDVIRYALEKREPLMTEHEAFRDAVLTRDESGIVTLKEGLEVVRTAERLVQSGLSERLPGKE